MKERRETLGWFVALLAHGRSHAAPEETVSWLGEQLALAPEQSAARIRLVLSNAEASCDENVVANRAVLKLVESLSDQTVGEMLDSFCALPRRGMGLNSSLAETEWKLAANIGLPVAIAARRANNLTVSEQALEEARSYLLRESESGDTSGMEGRDRGEKPHDKMRGELEPTEVPPSDNRQVPSERLYEALSELSTALPKLRGIQKLSDRLQALCPTMASKIAFTKYFNSLLRATGHLGLKVPRSNVVGELRYVETSEPGFAIAWQSPNGEEKHTKPVPNLSGLSLKAIPKEGSHVEPTLKALRLSEQSIKRLVTSDNHEEVCARFSKAREQVGLSVLEPAFHSYQKAIGAFSDEKRTGWSKELKREMTTRLNALAQALCAVFEIEGAQGRLDVTGARSGTFQLRASVARKRGTPIGIGQGLPLLKIRAAVD